MKRKNKNRASVSFLPSLPFLQQSRFTFSFYCLLPPSWLSSKWETIVLGPRPPHVPQFNGWIEERRNKSKNRTSDRLFRVNSFHTSLELLCLPLCKKKEHRVIPRSPHCCRWSIWSMLAHLLQASSLVVVVVDKLTDVSIASHSSSLEAGREW